MEQRCTRVKSTDHIIPVFNSVYKINLPWLNIVRVEDGIRSRIAGAKQGHGRKAGSNRNETP
jgi:hypothetical protein